MNQPIAPSNKKNNNAWFLILPALFLVMLTAIIPLITVINYSLLDYLTPQMYSWVGLEWFRDILKSSRFIESLQRSLSYSAIILLIEIPLGVFIALMMPKKGPGVSVCLILMALPMLIPWNIIPIIWKFFIHKEIGLAGHFFSELGFEFNWASDPLLTWTIIVLMDVWHWTSLVIFLCYASLTTIPRNFYQAAFIDGASRWNVFRFVEFPRIKRVLMMAVLLRFMDSFMIFTEPFFLNSGGPLDATTFLAQDLVEDSINYNYGPSAARSLIYFVIILIISWIFHTSQNRVTSDQYPSGGNP